VCGHSIPQSIIFRTGDGEFGRNATTRERRRDEFAQIFAGNDEKSG
jgi:hypothetical protein